MMMWQSLASCIYYIQYLAATKYATKFLTNDDDCRRGRLWQLIVQLDETA